MRFQTRPVSCGRGLKEVAPPFQEPFFFERERQELLFCTKLDDYCLIMIFFYDDMLVAPSNSLNLQQLHSVNVQSMNLTLRGV